MSYILGSVVPKKEIFLISNAAVTTINLQIFSHLIISQGKINIDKHPMFTQISQHQNQMEKHAMYYLKNLQPEFINAITGLQAMSGTYDALYRTLDDLCGKLLNHDDSRITFINALGRMISDAETNEAQLRHLNSEISTLRNDVVKDLELLSADRDIVREKIGSDQGLLRELENQINEVQTDITNKSIEGIVSVISAVGGTILIGIGAATELPTSGLSTGLIVAGIGFVLAGVGGTVHASTSIVEDTKKLGRLYTQLNDISENVAVFQFLYDHSLQLEQAITLQQGQMSKFQYVCTELIQNLSNLKQQVQSARFESDIEMIRAILRGSHVEWLAVKKEMNLIQKKLTDIRFEEVKDVTKLDSLIEKEKKELEVV